MRLQISQPIKAPTYEFIFASAGALKNLMHHSPHENLTPTKYTKKLHVSCL
jgi:hypothetical protein